MAQIQVGYSQATTVKNATEIDIQETGQRANVDNDTFSRHDFAINCVNSLLRDNNVGASMQQLNFNYWNKLLIKYVVYITMVLIVTMAILMAPSRIEYLVYARIAFYIQQLHYTLICCYALRLFFKQRKAYHLVLNLFGVKDNVLMSRMNMINKFYSVTITRGALYTKIEQVMVALNTKSHAVAERYQNVESGFKAQDSATFHMMFYSGDFEKYHYMVLLWSLLQLIWLGCVIYFFVNYEYFLTLIYQN